MKYPNSILREQDGIAFLMFILVLLPFLVLVLSVSFDASGLLRERRSEQSVIESAALFGAKGLPFLEETRRLTKNYLLENSTYLKSLPEAERESKIIFPNDDKNNRQRVSVEMRADYKIKLGSFFSRIDKFVPDKLEYLVSATAVAAPQNVVIYIDKGRYLAPFTYEEADGTDINESNLSVWTGFRSGGYLSDYKKESLDQAEERLEEDDSDGTANSKDPPPWRESQMFKRKFNADEPNLAGKSILLTQQCFNPVWSALKQAAIHSYDYLGNFPDNSVAVLTGPVRGGNTLEIHPMIKAGVAQSTTVGEAKLEKYYDPSALSTVDGDKDEDRPTIRRVVEQHCLFTADNAGSLQRRWLRAMETAKNQGLPPKRWPRPTSKAYFAIPFYSTKLDPNLLLPNSRAADANIRLTERYANADEVENDGATKIPGDGILASGARKFLTTREAIWAQPVHRDRELDITDAIKDVADQLIDAPVRNDRLISDDLVKSVGYIFLGDLPHLALPGVSLGVSGRHPRLNYLNHSGDDAARHFYSAITSTLAKVSSQAAAKDKVINLYLIFVRHPGRFCAGARFSQVCSEFTEPLEELEMEIKRSNTANLNVRVVPVPDIGSLAVEIPALLPLAERSTLLTYW